MAKYGLLDGRVKDAIPAIPIKKGRGYYGSADGIDQTQVNVFAVLAVFDEGSLEFTFDDGTKIHIDNAPQCASFALEETVTGIAGSAIVYAA